MKLSSPVFWRFSSSLLARCNSLPRRWYFLSNSNFSVDALFNCSRVIDKSRSFFSTVRCNVFTISFRSLIITWFSCFSLVASAKRSFSVFISTSCAVSCCLDIRRNLLASASNAAIWLSNCMARSRVRLHWSSKSSFISRAAYASASDRFKALVLYSSSPRSLPISCSASWISLCCSVLIRCFSSVSNCNRFVISISRSPSRRSFSFKSISISSTFSRTLYSSFRYWSSSSLASSWFKTWSSAIIFSLSCFAVSLWAALASSIPLFALARSCFNSLISSLSSSISKPHDSTVLHLAWNCSFSAVRTSIRFFKLLISNSVCFNSDVRHSTLFAYFISSEWIFCSSCWTFFCMLHMDSDWFENVSLDSNIAFNKQPSFVLAVWSMGTSELVDKPAIVKPFSMSSTPS